MKEFADTGLSVSGRNRTAPVVDVGANFRRDDKQFSTHDREPIRQDFVDATSSTVTGVNLITTNGLAGRFGLTISAMSSVSADPPMLLACINQKSPMCHAILVNRHFCVNVLSTYQHHLARIFAGIVETGGAYDFDAAQWELGTANVPRLIDAVSTFDCVLENAQNAGSHRIFIGRVTAATAHKSTPLLYTTRSYGFPLTWS